MLVLEGDIFRTEGQFTPFVCRQTLLPLHGLTIQPFAQD